MRITAGLLTAAMASGVVTTLFGCSGSGLTAAQSPVLDGTMAQARAYGSSSPESAATRLNSPIEGILPLLRPPTDLAVSDYGGGPNPSAVEILNKKYQLTETITSGIAGANSDWYDTSGNLYVTNYANPEVQEYPNGASSPSFTYSNSLNRPEGVTTDSAGNVYVADAYLGSGTGIVFEFAQGSNSILHQCLNGLNNIGVAVDKHGDVFVSGTSQQYPNAGLLLEYKGGLSGCTPTTLGVQLTSAGGLQLDKKNNLVACDERGHVVDIIPPPYTSVSLTISGFESPAHTALNKAESLLYVADPGNYNVQVLTYPGGTYVTMLDSSNGLSDPSGVATYPAAKT